MQFFYFCRITILNIIHNINQLILMPLLSDRIKYFTDSVIRRMTRVANAHGAINFSQGFPDFDPPVELKKALQDVASGSIHQYAITWGAPNFREALAKKQSNDLFWHTSVDGLYLACRLNKKMFANPLMVSG
jgi:hypothetical protein